MTKMVKAIPVLLLPLCILSCGLKDVEYWHAAGVKAEMAGKDSEAQTAYQEALKLDTRHFASLFNLGNVQFRAKNWKEARKSYINAIIERTNSASAYCNLGLAYLELKDRDKAYECFRIAWQSDKNEAQPVLAHARALADESKTADAIKLLEQCVKLTNPRVHFNTGMLYYESGEYANAGKAFARADKHLPREPRILVMMCRTQLKLKALDEAEKSLAALRLAAPAGGQAALLAAEVDLARGRTDAAEKTVNEHLALYPDSHTGLLLAGEIAYRRRDPELALRYFNRAAAVDYTSKEAALRAVDVMFELKRISDARDRLALLVKSFPEDIRILDGLMRIYFQQAYYDKAAFYGEKRLAATPKSRPAEAEVITGLAHLMNEDVSKRDLVKGIKYLWPHRNATPPNKLLLRYLYGALVEKKEDAKADEVRRLL